MSSTPPRAVVQLSDIINNMKCDMLTFMRDNTLMRERGGTIGGLLKFHLDRSHEIGGGVRVVGVPVVEGVQVGGEMKGSNTASFGEVFTVPFTINYSATDHETVSCEPGDRTVGVIEPGSSQPTRAVLTAPLLDLGALRQELDLIKPGNPKVKFADFTFAGSVVLARSRDTGFRINVIWLSPSFSNSTSSDYKIEYEIGTNWKHILSAAHYDVDPEPIYEKAEPPHFDTVSGIPNAVWAKSEPPAAGRRKPRAAKVTSRHH